MIRRWTQSMIFAVLALSLTLAVAGCGGGAQPGTEDPIKIGTILAFTGDLASFGPPMRNGADVAVEPINNGSGVLGRPLEIVHRDSGTSSHVAIEAARALIDVYGVHAIVGPLGSGATQSVAEAITIPAQVSNSNYGVSHGHWWGRGCPHGGGAMGSCGPWLVQIAPSPPI